MNGGCGGVLQLCLMNFKITDRLSYWDRSRPWEEIKMLIKHHHCRKINALQLTFVKEHTVTTMTSSHRLAAAFIGHTFVTSLIRHLSRLKIASKISLYGVSRPIFITVTGQLYYNTNKVMQEVKGARIISTQYHHNQFFFSFPFCRIFVCRKQTMTHNEREWLLVPFWKRKKRLAWIILGKVRFWRVSLEVNS